MGDRALPVDPLPLNNGPDSFGLEIRGTPTEVYVVVAVLAMLLICNLSLCVRKMYQTMISNPRAAKKGRAQFRKVSQISTSDDEATEINQ